MAGTRFSDAGMNELLLALSEGVFEQPMWRGFVRLLRAQTGAGRGALTLRADEVAALLRDVSGVGEPALPPLAAELRALRPDRVYAQDEIAGIAGAAGYCRIVRIVEASGADAWLAIAGERGFGAAAGAYLARLTPHLRAALRSFAALERERTRSSIAAAAMGQLSLGWLMLDARCRILDMTAGVEPLLQRTDLLRRDRYAQLSFAAPAIERAVAALVRRYAAGRGGRPQAFSLSRDPWLDVLLKPAGRVADGSVGGGAGAAVATLHLSGDRRSRQERCEQLSRLFGLQPSEARLAWAVAQGRSIAEAAADLGLAVETARGYSKQVYAKTGASGQAALVRIVLTSILAS